MGETARRAPRQAGSRVQTASSEQSAERTEAARSGAADDSSTVKPSTAAITVVKPNARAGEEEARIPKLAVVGDNKKPAKDKPAAPNPLRGQTSNKSAGKRHEREMAVGMTGAILSGGFSLLASRLGPHWSLTEQETKQLSEPIVALLDRYKLLEKIAVQNDWVALLAAIGMTITPKVIIGKQMKALKKAQEKGGNANVQPVRSGLQSIPGGKPANADARAPVGSREPVQGQSSAAADGGTSIKSLLVETQLAE